MLKLEISQDSIKDAPVETKTKLTNDLMRLLQVREKNVEMAKDWLLFLATSKFNKLTAGEIYNAFKLAMSRELKDAKGNDFELLPELSNNTTAKVLTAYMESKLLNTEYYKAKKALTKTSDEITHDEIAERRERFIEHLFEELNEKGICTEAWILYDELEQAGKIKVSNEEKKKLYADQLEVYQNELTEDRDANKGNEKFRHSLEFLMDQIKLGKKNRVVQNRCRSILVIEYLKAFCSDLSAFKNELANDNESNVCQSHDCSNQNKNT
ncbi:hypothetical protein [Flavobacterium sp.]|uniref:hypothetical protein n=1 Tax=Flavobacterium sp. TaxID=239 RepID=UPI0025C14CC9|nr:hypothetical protein [Flavobacterium sp.]